MAEMAISNMLECSSSHLLQHNRRESIQTVALLFCGCGKSSQISDVDTTLVHELTQRMTVHRKPNVAIMELIHQIWNDLASQQVAHRAHFSFICFVFLLFHV